MKHALLVLVCVVTAALAAPGRAAAQIAGMPVWNSPKSGTGFTLAADYGSPDSAGGNGSTYAGRVVFGMSVFTLSAMVGERQPGGSAPNVTEYGGTGALRLIGGSLMPVSMNLQGGYATYKEYAQLINDQSARWGSRSTSRPRGERGAVDRAGRAPDARRVPERHAIWRGRGSDDRLRDARDPCGDGLREPGGWGTHDHVRHRGALLDQAGVRSLTCSQAHIQRLPLERAATHRASSFPRSRVKRMFARAILVALALSTNGCASTFDASHLGVTATMAEPALPPVAGTTFKISRHPVYLIWGMFPMGGANLEDLLAGQLGMNASIAKLRIKVRVRRVTCSYADYRGPLLPHGDLRRGSRQTDARGAVAPAASRTSCCTRAVVRSAAPRPSRTTC